MDLLEYINKDLTTNKQKRCLNRLADNSYNNKNLITKLKPFLDTKENATILISYLINKEKIETLLNNKIGGK